MEETITHTILVVDDEPDVLSALYDTLIDVYEVMTASNGADALRIISDYENEIAVVISDQRMPGMTGSQLMAKIHETHPRCNKILLTAYGDIKVVKEAINKGAINTYMYKPWNAEVLLCTVEHLIKMYDLDDDNLMNKVIENNRRMRTEGDILKPCLNLMTQFIDSFQIGICIVDDSGNIALFNKTGLELLKYDSLDAVKGKKLNSVFSLDNAVIKRFRSSYKQGRHLHPLDLKQADGKTTVMDSSLTFLNDGEGALNGILFSG
ncbi:MAG: response regulator [Candidatus Magnetominusculus sp. LBB02]|nr:response regulator [Candidatus Magnetominusculus sp. LBB02]